ncbi:methylated-DNA-[protein]-cysteine S-methyltransferase [Peribacillus deserti]|uniref:Methylated-DNA--protein-cysteine methyltransferase n=1 Tax=Peribacillus deserti TaxID=673318 RepID=A0ABS2QD51_9BACI|nr:methylated-DNA--[protein]-cysteine S-methyltransferase [Peribacillus deserti]MBM7691097.1 methylated-DNA-[protein]-cysteine S-methyltransferase [Peribacillus deserti]
MIYTGYYESPIGLIKIESTDRHILSLRFSERGTVLPAQGLQHPIIGEALTQLAEYFKGARISFSLPLEKRGTPFQKKVWEQVNTISFGSTRSYMDIAYETGSAKAVRAVGNANSKNKLLIVIPCHRVVGSRGQLTGYAEGIWRKEWLLNHEKVSLNKHKNPIV